MFHVLVYLAQVDSQTCVYLLDYLIAFYIFLSFFPFMYLVIIMTPTPIAICKVF